VHKTAGASAGGGGPERNAESPAHAKWPGLVQYVMQGRDRIQTYQSVDDVDNAFLEMGKCC
jgi:hypothetical protein